MEKEKLLKLKEYKKEFQEEINSVDIKIPEFKKLKVSNSILATEVSLRKVFGDEIYKNNNSNVDVSGEKSIIKLDEDSIAFDKQVLEISENIADEKFDSNVNVFLDKINNEEN